MTVLATASLASITATSNRSHWLRNHPHPHTTIMEYGDLCSSGRELYLHIKNNSLVCRAFFDPVARNLSKKFKRGEFILDRAIDGMNYCAINAAKDYHREHGSMQQPWHQLFPVGTRRAVAEVMAREVYEEFKLGNFWA